jgi:hypothetical protein
MALAVMPARAPSCASDFHDAQIARLGRGIVHLTRLALLPVDRGDHDDAAELALAHAGPDRVDGVEDAGEVGVDHLLPLLRRHLVEHRVAGDARVGDHDLDGPQIGLDLWRCPALELS